MYIYILTFMTPDITFSCFSIVRMILRADTRGKLIKTSEKCLATFLEIMLIYFGNYTEKTEWKIARILPGSAVGHEKQISKFSISSRWRCGLLYLLMSSFGVREEERGESPLNKH
jgi:hypothetical protein